MARRTPAPFNTERDWKVECPICDAKPGQPCRSQEDNRVLRYGHTQRINWQTLQAETPDAP